MQKYIPLLALLFILSVLAALYGPGMLARISLGKSVNALLESARSGDLSAVLSHVRPASRQSFGGLLERYVPEGYESYIESLHSTRFEPGGSGAMIVSVNCRLQSSAGPVVYQARLLWQRSNGVWEWDPAASYAAPFSTSGEPQWILLGDLMQQAGEEI